MKISITHSGNFNKTEKFLERAKHIVKLADLDKYGQRGVAALSAATPVDSGKTASSWIYEVTYGRNSMRLDFKNTNVNKGVPIAVILQYGHGTRNGGFVQGRDYINPAIQPIFDQITEDLWKEVAE